MNTLTVVTGAAHGIGSAIAEAMADRGDTIVAVDRDGEACRQVVGAIVAAGGRAEAVEADLTTEEGRAQVRAAVARHPDPLATLVNNAGITRDALLAKMSDEQFEVVLEVNLGAAHLLTELLVPHLRDGGCIVNISSRAYLGNVGQFNYAASKGGLVGLTRALALELAPRGIRVNAVAPGLTRTAMAAAMPDDVRDAVVGRIPMGRMGEPSEIAAVVRFLASETSSYVSGQVISVDGARTVAG